MRTHRYCTILAVAACLASTAVSQPPPPPPLPPAPFPPQNPFSETKRLLGKMLFWDEQLSSDNTVACGTCHRPANAGADPRVGRHPGLDGILNTPDDFLGSPGVIRSDAADDYERDAIFGLLPQATARAAPTALMAMFAPDLFWDGRARTTFVDPQTGLISIPTGGALESQAVAPIPNDTEMSHENRDWNQIAAKLAAVRPMALAAGLPADMSAALQANPSYPALFAAAFGDAAITAQRIAFAIATYERTLVPNQTPWDAFNAGNQNALTPGQRNGLQALQATTCFACHTPPQFTDNTFRNIGLRPVAEDRGRQNVTNNPADRGRFKVPTLRNVGLKPRFMHNGQLGSLNQVLDFYLQVNGQVQFPDNRDPLVPQIFIPPQARPAVVDFLSNGLRDPRVAAGQFPFDRPALHSELNPPNPSLLATATPGSGGFAPVMIALCPPNLGNTAFKIGLDRALGGANAFVLMSSSPPVNNVLVPEQTFGPIVLAGSGSGQGFATWHWPIPDDAMLNGQVVFLQWVVEDPAAPGGLARSRVARLTLFCTSCPCPGSADGDRDVDQDDLDVIMFNFGATVPPGTGGDVNGDGVVDQDDLDLALGQFGIACP